MVTPVIIQAMVFTMAILAIIQAMAFIMDIPVIILVMAFTMGTVRSTPIKDNHFKL